MFANIDYALATARVDEMHRDARRARHSSHGSLAERIRSRREAARRARTRHSTRPRLRAA